MGHGPAPDQEHALVAFLDFRDIALGHDGAAAEVRDGLDDDVDVGIVLARAKHRRAAHAVERLQNHVAVLRQEFPDERLAPRYHGGRRELGKPGDRHLLVPVADRARAVEYARALRLRKLEKIGAVDILHVERRILAHQHGVEIP